MFLKQERDEGVSEEEESVSNIEEPARKKQKKKKLTSLHMELDGAIKKALSSKPTATTVNTTQSDKNLLKLIRQELNLFENNGNRGLLLTKAYRCLFEIKPTSIESERAFSSAGYICSKIRSRMNDDTLDHLCFLRTYFNHEK